MNINVDLSFNEKQKLAWEYLNDNTHTELLFGGAAGGWKIMARL